MKLMQINNTNISNIWDGTNEWSKNLLIEFDLGLLSSISISSIPGLRFYLGNTINTSDLHILTPSVYIGPTGLFQLTVNDILISDIRIHKPTYDNLITNGNGYCYIDIIGTKILDVIPEASTIISGGEITI